MGTKKDRYYKTRMELSSKKPSNNLSQTQYITYILKIMNLIDIKYQKARDVASKTMCTNIDPNIDSPHWKCVCRYVQQFSPCSMPD